MNVEQVNTIELNLANQKDIICYNVIGLEQGSIKEGFTKLKDVYDFIKECKRIDKEELNEEDKNTLLETIKDLKYQNNTNEEIIKLLESNMVKEKLKNV